MKIPDMYQSVIITFSDGSTGVFTGVAVVLPGTTLTVTDVKFSLPTQLPEGCRFEPMETYNPGPNPHIGLQNHLQDRHDNQQDQPHPGQDRERAG